MVTLGLLMFFSLYLRIDSLYLTAQQALSETEDALLIKASTIAARDEKIASMSKEWERARSAASHRAEVDCNRRINRSTTQFCDGLRKERDADRNEKVTIQTHLACYRTCIQDTLVRAHCHTYSTDEWKLR